MSGASRRTWGWRYARCPAQPEEDSKSGSCPPPGLRPRCRFAGGCAVISSGGTPFRLRSATARTIVKGRFRSGSPKRYSLPWGKPPGHFGLSPRRRRDPVLRELLQAALEGREDGISLHPLYGDLPLRSRSGRSCLEETQSRAGHQHRRNQPHHRRGEGRNRQRPYPEAQYDPATGMNRLITVPVSRAAAEQRKGRPAVSARGLLRLYSRMPSSPAFFHPARDSDFRPFIAALNLRPGV